MTEEAVRVLTWILIELHRTAPLQGTLGPLISIVPEPWLTAVDHAGSRHVVLVGGVQLGFWCSHQDPGEEEMERLDFDVGKLSYNINRGHQKWL